ncbi:hypothetical protein QQP08_003868 [Theobroma cacao]|nr:hypothetical protein QQP08_003868 [Theobroma cacao]
MKALGKSHNNDVVGDDNRNDFVFVKDFRIDDGDSAIQKVNSLNASRTALENLEDQLEIFHTVHTQQRAERDASFARLEQSRIILALRLAEHHLSPSGRGRILCQHGGKRSNMLTKVVVSGFNFAKQSLKFHYIGGIRSNTALFAV